MVVFCLPLWLNMFPFVSYKMSSLDLSCYLPGRLQAVNKPGLPKFSLMTAAPFAAKEAYLKDIFGT